MMLVLVACGAEESEANFSEANGEGGFVGHPPLLGGKTEEALIDSAVDDGSELGAEELIPWGRLDTPITADVTVDWTEAKDRVGEFLAVEGIVVDTHNSGRACFLNFTSEWRGTFYLAILGSNMEDYPESPERYFLNKKVRAVGKVDLYRDRPQIVIESPQHITILGQ
ncbi:MAG: hypothetical protein MK209_09560 [Planctomycetes bacterium]|nr:hypothetical protein [Planctomycetota bacterium]